MNEMAHARLGCSKERPLRISCVTFTSHHTIKKKRRRRRYALSINTKSLVSMIRFISVNFAKVERQMYRKQYYRKIVFRLLLIK